ncbi:tyrosine-type recombinase/integrase [Vibrio sp. PNB23_22_6]
MPAEEIKGRRKYRVPLTKQAMNILEQIKAQSEGKGFVFPNQRNPDSHMSSSTANAALKRCLGYKGVLVSHGLRAIASTVLHEQGFDTLHIEACLAHKDENMTRPSYNRSDFFEQRKEIMCWWSEYIEKASKGLSIS